MTRIIHTASNSKPLQRFLLVWKVFNEKTVVALTTLQKLKINEASICVLVQVIINRFKMMNVEDKYSVYTS